MDQDQKRSILEFMNSGNGRMLRSALGGMLLAGSGNLLGKALGGVLIASGPMDFCPTNAALGYPLSGEDTRQRLAQEA
ncbi:hypothetical protein SAMN04488058_10888 [Deinococcus reticulitermitis]|uniref:DUF2892 domain-containing protein n=1 Tax=Deinococcus reticulitermitis TaxID=856736 RepID=A0A1H6YV22_9DEIO|nr:hypothetical protein [Deinococcus reticulitermitis]SEJ45069.1 hypothetical protein SAMN04488058_10888 [Deinococcus reticulitermitis]